MIVEAEDFRAESEALAALIAPLAAPDYARPTQFKAWSIDDVLGHLFLWNQAARRSLDDPAGFQAFLGEMRAALSGPGAWRAYERDWRGALAGPALAAAWRADAAATATAFARADPKARVAWVGPAMSARSAITARLMETWAHAQAVYDLLGVERQDDDRIRAIAQLGVNTFAWSFQNRSLAPPGPCPQVRLTAPSGAIWTWNPDNALDRVEGPATAFCQVTTQTRALADVPLSVRGPVATAWMAIAQCFAGPPNDPPAPGSRRRAA